MSIGKEAVMSASVMVEETYWTQHQYDVESSKGALEEVDYSEQPLERLMKSVVVLFSGVKLQIKQVKIKLLSEQRSMFREAYADLLLWGEIFDAGKPDVVLEDALTLRRLVTDLTISIGKLLYCWLHESRDLSHNATMAQDDDLRDFLKRTEIMQHIVEGTGSDTDSSSSDDEDDECQCFANMDLTKRCAELYSYTSSLMDLASDLEAAVFRYEQRRLEDEGEKDAAVNGSESFTEAIRPYALKIQDRFPQAQPLVIEALAKANLWRFKRIRQAKEVKPTIPTELAASDCSRSILVPGSLFHDSGIGTSVPAATTIYAESFVSTQSQRDGSSLRVPPAPKAASDGQLFICPVCQKLVSGIFDRAGWKAHLFQDLEPYVCIDPTCCKNLRIFSSRDAWAQHSAAHADSSEHVQFVSADGRQVKHIGHDGREQGRDTELHALSDASCPLCDTSLQPSPKGYASHIGRHMQSIALASLPTELFAEDDGNDNTDGASSESQRSPALSTSEQDSSTKLEGISRPIADAAPVMHPVYEDERDIRHFIERCKARFHPKTRSPQAPTNGQYPCPREGCTALFANQSQWLRHREINFPRTFSRCTICRIVTSRQIRDHLIHTHRLKSVSDSADPNSWVHFREPIDYNPQACVEQCEYCSRSFHGSRNEAWLEAQNHVWHEHVVPSSRISEAVPDGTPAQDLSISDLEASAGDAYDSTSIDASSSGEAQLSPKTTPPLGPFRSSPSPQGGESDSHLDFLKPFPLYQASPEASDSDVASSEKSALVELPDKTSSFECHICPKRFERAHNLRSHLRTHPVYEAGPEGKTVRTRHKSVAEVHKRVATNDELVATPRSKHPAVFECHLCTKQFTRAYNLRLHLRTHTDGRPFLCTVCGKAFARQHDRKRHEGLHSGEKRFTCRGIMQDNAGTNTGTWGCGRRFARVDALSRHFGAGAGRACIQPLFDAQARHGTQDSYAQSTWPAALLAQYPALAAIDPTAPLGPIGASDFEHSDYSNGTSDYGDLSDYDHGEGRNHRESGMDVPWGNLEVAGDGGYDKSGDPDYSGDPGDDDHHASSTVGVPHSSSSKIG